MKKTMMLILIVLSIVLLGCAKEETIEKEPAEEAGEEYIEPKQTTGVSKRVTLTTDDGIGLVASYYPGRENAVILLHMLNRDRSDWKEFASELNRRGYTVIAPDLRGHGDSDLNWMSFKDPDFQKMVNDVAAAADYIYRKNEVDIESVYVVGASIGANLAVMYGVTDQNVKKVVMLSPGSTYHGLNPLDAVFDFNKPILLVYSQRDTYSANSARTMEEMGKAERKMIAYRDSHAHGTDMFAEHDTAGDDLEQDIIDFIKS